MNERTRAFQDTVRLESTSISPLKRHEVLAVSHHATVQYFRTFLLRRKLHGQIDRSSLSDTRRYDRS